MSRIQDQMNQHELESLLYGIDYSGFLLIPLRKLYRLLDKGNRAAGTWIALLEAWESIGGNAKELYIIELSDETLLLTKEPNERVHKWAHP